MTPDRDDPVLDALLDEVLADRRPPDLTPRILRAREGDGASPALEAISPEPPPILAGLSPALIDDKALIDDMATADRTATPAAATRRAADSRRGRQRGRFWRPLPLAISASAALSLALIVSIVTLLQTKRPGLADNTAVASVPATAANVGQPASVDPPPIPKDRIASESSLPPQPPVNDARDPRQLANISSLPATATPERAAPLRAAIEPRKPAAPPSPRAEIVSFINEGFAQTWADADVKPTPAASDSEWCQRVFLRIVGRLPNAAELKSFVEDETTDRREQLVERLLTQRRYVQAYAQHWATLWASALIGRAGGQPGSLGSREELEKYLAAALAANKPFYRITQDLLTATGSSKPGASDYNPAVNFLLEGADANAIVPTARVSRVFLGHQLQCAQCHTHPSQEWSQEQFWALNSFFRQMKAEREGESARLVNVDFPGQLRGSRGGEVFYETPDGLMKTAFPRFLDGTPIAASGELAVVDRRHELARLVVQSDDLPRAVVNRVWGQLFDYGFTRPIDDLGPHASVTQPAVLDRLATEFAAHDYDLKSLIRWSVLSEPFNRSSKISDLVSKDMPEDGERALFSRYYARPPQAAEVFGSLVQAARIRRTAPSDADREKARVDWLAQFNRTAQKKAAKAKGDGPALMIKTTEPVVRTTGNEAGGLLKRVAASKMAFDKKVEHLFLSAAARQPTAREQRAAADLLRTSGDEAIALEDTWWALLNSGECTLDR